MSTSPLAVCIIVENLPVPFDRRVWQEARALREAGFHVSVICPKGRGYERSRENRDGVEIYRHGIWEAAAPLGYLIEYSWALAAEFYLALKVFARTRFRVLHACNPPDTIFLIGRFFKILGVRFLFDHHDLNPELYEAKFGRGGLLYRIVCLAERLTFRAADVSIATNDSYREVAVGRGGMNPERVFIVRSAPDLRYLHPLPERPELRQGKRYLVVYVGVMGPQEGLDLLLESVAYIVERRKREDTQFVLIGSGSELPALKTLTTHNGLDAFVKYTDRIPDDQLAAYLSTADVCVAPDPLNPMNDKSTMNKILEYMAFARPVVLYDLAEGQRTAGESALYARPGDPVDFAEQILKLLDSESLRRQLGDSGRRRIKGSLNWEVEKKSLLRAYSMALGSGGMLGGQTPSRNG